MEERSPNVALAATGSMLLSTGFDSPVRTASCICKLLAAIKRRSAGILSPAFSNTMSPGTKASAAIVWRFAITDHTCHW